MGRRKVQKIMPVSATSSSRQVAINHTNSILSDPDGRWVAKRQGTINEAFEKRTRLASDHGSSQNVEFSEDPTRETSRFLYLVQPGGVAMRYGVGIGHEGFAWQGDGVRCGRVAV